MLIPLQTTIPGYRCPSDVGPKTNTTRDQFPSNGTPQIALATSNYAAAESSWNIFNADNTTFAEERKGLFIEDQGRNFSDITDGASNVIAVGERRWRIKRSTDGSINTVAAAVIFGIQRRDNDGAIGDAAACGRVKMNNSYDNIGTTNWARRGYSSQHPGGAQFVFADGSVHFISETIQHDADATQISQNGAVNTTYERLIAIADGNPTGDF